MSYVHITRLADITLGDYEQVRRSMGDEPIAGQVAHVVGRADGELHIIDVWASKADADRFAAERLFPAFERAGFAPSSATTILAFEAGAGDE